MARSRTIALGALGLVLGACTSGAGEGPTRQSAPSVAPAATAAGAGAGGTSAGVPTEAEAGAGPALTEVAARLLLSERFRAAGFRIRNDVAVAGEGYELTADGYDPDRGVGYEYIATEEVGTDLVDAERVALGRDSERHVLVLGPCDEASLRRSADAFLGGLGVDGDEHAASGN